MDKQSMIANRDYFFNKKIQELDVNAGTESDNLFQIFGTVIIDEIYAIVTDTVGAADCDTVYLNLFPTGGAAIDITLAAGVDIKAAPIGSNLAKVDDATGALALISSSLGAVSELVVGGAPFFPHSPFKVVQKVGIATYIRCTYTSTMAPCTGQLTWHVKWEPRGDGSRLVSV